MFILYLCKVFNTNIFVLKIWLSIIQKVLIKKKKKQQQTIKNYLKCDLEFKVLEIKLIHLPTFYMIQVVELILGF